MPHVLAYSSECSYFFDVHSHKNIPKTILVIEDEASILDILELTLRSEGYRMLGAKNGIEGLAVFEKCDPKPFLILLDLMMPQMNGVSFLKERAFHPKLSKVPVIAVTAYAERLESVQADAFLEKPIRIEELIGAIKKFDPDST